MKKVSLIFFSLCLVASMVSGAGCKKGGPEAVPESGSAPEVVIEMPTSSTKFPETNLEYYLQSYRDHVLGAGQKIDKKKVKPFIVVTGIDQADKQKMTVTLYTDAKWSDGKDRIFTVEEVKGASVRQFGEFSSVVANLVKEIDRIEKGKVIGDFMKLESIQ